jgi:predicted chitinase
VPAWHWWHSECAEPNFDPADIQSATHEEMNGGENGKRKRWMDKNAETLAGEMR